MPNTTLRAGIAALALTATTLLAGCSDNGDMSGMPMGQSSSSSTPAASNPTSPHNGQDVVFAQMMIPHHRQAIEMSNLILAKKSVDPRVTKLARQIKAAQGAEITTMRGWLTDWGANPSPSPMHHGNMGGMGGMGDGMMNPVEMLKLKNAHGNQAAKMFLTGMIRHHRGAIAMAKTETDRGQNAAAKKLANSIITSQQAEIDTMNKLLRNL